MNPSVRCAQIVIKSCMNPPLKISPAPLGIDMWCPGHSQRVHSKFVFKNMCCIKAVLATRPGNYAVVRSVVAAMSIAQLPQLRLTLIPVDFFLLRCDFAGVTDIL